MVTPTLLSKQKRIYNAAAAALISKSLKDKTVLPQKHLSTNVSNHILNDNRIKSTSNKLLQLNPNRWHFVLSNVIGRLAQGNRHNVPFSNAIRFIKKSDIPPATNIKYANFVWDHRPLKSESWRTRLVVGGDKLPYFDDSGSPAANLLGTKFPKYTTTIYIAKSLKVCIA